MIRAGRSILYKGGGGGLVSQSCLTPATVACQASLSMGFSRKVVTIKIESPAQVRCMILDAWGWCTGMTQRDGTGREEGGGVRMGNTLYLWRIHVDVWQNQCNIVK